MARIRLNADFRTKIGNRGRLHFEQVHTQEKEKYIQLKEDDKLDIGYNFFIRDFVEVSNIKENELVEIPNEPN